MMERMIKSLYDKNRKLHSEQGPALIRLNGDKVWYFHGKVHRENGPAVELADGTKEWWEFGELLRIEYYDGEKNWYKHGKLLHREDGPAIEYSNGDKVWCLEDKILPSYVQTVEQLKSYIRNKILW